LAKRFNELPIANEFSPPAAQSVRPTWEVLILMKPPVFQEVSLARLSGVCAKAREVMMARQKVIYKFFIIRLLRIEK
jgi:hypothetical protein